MEQFGFLAWLLQLQELWELLATGGPVLLIIAGLSIVALTIVLLKLFQMASLRPGTRDFVEEALTAAAAGNGDRALNILARTRNPIARTMELAIRGRRDGVSERRDLEEKLARDGAAQVALVRRYLRVLEQIATLAPLLGLLGTVLGMIEAFQALEAAGSRVNPSLLSGGIWTALLTTAAGLIVAIPVAAAHNLFEGVAERFTLALEDAVTRTLVGPFPEVDMAEQPSRGSLHLTAGAAS